MMPLMEFQCSTDQHIELNQQTHKSACGQCGISERAGERERRGSGERRVAPSHQKTNLLQGDWRIDRNHGATSTMLMPTGTERAFTQAHVWCQEVWLYKFDGHRQTERGYKERLNKRTTNINANAFTHRQRVFQWALKWCESVCSTTTTIRRQNFRLKIPICWLKKCLPFYVYPHLYPKSIIRNPIWAQEVGP